MENEDYDLECSVEETKYYLERQYDSVDSVKNTSRDILTAISLLTTIWAFLQIDEFSFDFTSFSMHLLTRIVVIVSYLAILILTGILAQLNVMCAPIAIDWEVFQTLFFNQSKKKILENRLENYLQAVNLNRKKITRLNKIIKALFVLYLILICSLCLSFVFH